MSMCLGVAEFRRARRRGRFGAFVDALMRETACEHRSRRWRLAAFLRIGRTISICRRCPSVLCHGIRHTAADVRAAAAALADGFVLAVSARIARTDRVVLEDQEPLSR